MTTYLTPYLHFRGNAREAMDFYVSVLGGSLVRSTYAELHATVEPDEQNLIMHSMLTTDAGLTIAASDAVSHMQHTPGDTIALALSGTDEVELTEYWDRLMQGGTALEPLSKAPWGDSFGMLDDRFGIRWMVNIASGGPSAS